ncbi:MAG TPA: NfeD family protein [Burkholderiales bacterium]|nr:NfeD family protein [Burkholderiales bacterium]
MMQFLWWHWVVLGIVLLLLELAVPAFFLVWFGLGALIVGVVLLAIPSLSFAWQILIWIVFSLAFIWMWFKVFKPGFYKTRAGMSKGAVIGEIGLVIRDIRPFEKGQIRFQKPMLGDEVWESIADEEIKAGERVKVLDVEGNILKVVRT